MAEEIKRMEFAADPERCKAVTSSGQGQCQNKIMPGSNYCQYHANQNRSKNYNLKFFQVEIAEKAASQDIKGLRDEIGILRLLLESQINRCKDTSDLLMATGPISDLTLKIKDIVQVCHKLEGSMGKLVDRSQIIQFGAQVVQIISKYISDEQILEGISSDIIAAMNKED